MESIIVCKGQTKRGKSAVMGGLPIVPNKHACSKMAAKTILLVITKETKSKLSEPCTIQQTNYM